MVRTLARSLPLWLTLSCLALPAQVQPGQQAPPLGARFVAAGDRLDDDAAVAVVLFHRALPSAVLDADLARALRAELGPRGLQLALVVPAADGPPPAPLAGLPVAVDADGSARNRWLGNQRAFYAVVTVRGTVAWIGRPEHGLIAAARAAGAGDLDPAASQVQWARRQQLLAEFADGDRDALRALAEQLSRDCPTDGTAWGLRFLVEVQRFSAEAGARAALDGALAALPAEPRALAAFADLALRGAPQNRGLGVELQEPMTTAAKAAPDDLRVQLTLLRTLVRAGDGRGVGMLSHRLARKVETVPNAALEFVEILAHDDPPQIHKDLAMRVLEAARNGGADLRLFTATRYQYLLRCEDDRDAARDTAIGYMDQAPGRVTLNNDAWYFLSELPTNGRYDAFALALAERMLEQREALEFFECDTVALAMFRNGRFDDAVELQQLAIHRGADGAVYQQRLELYRAAAQKATAPR